MTEITQNLDTFTASTVAAMLEHGQQLFESGLYFGHGTDQCLG